MTLEEAIKHCKEKSCGESQCALEHKQLSEWLMELKAYRQEYGRLNNNNKEEGEALLYTANKVAERTKKEMINKACKWLKYRTEYPFTDSIIESFKEYMEDEDNYGHN